MKAEGTALAWIDHCHRQYVKDGWDVSLMCIFEWAYVPNT